MRELQFDVMAWSFPELVVLLLMDRFNMELLMTAS
jgi:hypothetical protein